MASTWVHRQTSTPFHSLIRTIYPIFGVLHRRSTHHFPTVIMETLNMSCFHFATMACAINRAKHIQKFLSNLVQAHASHELAGVETLNMQTWMHGTRTFIYISEIMRKTPMIIIIENIRRSTALLLSYHERQSCKMLNIFYSLFDSLVVFSASTHRARAREFGIRFVYLCLFSSACELKME